MTYYDILDGAVAAICEDVTNTRLIEDYILRGQFIMANFVTQYAKLDATYRQAHEMESREITLNTTMVDLEDEFPMSDIFVPVAVHYLAAGMVIDENEEMSDKYFDRYINGILQIRKELPAKQGAIVDKYGLN